MAAHSVDQRADWWAVQMAALRAGWKAVLMAAQ